VHVVVDHRQGAVAEDLPGGGAGRHAHPFGLGAARLQAAKFIEHLPQKNDDVAWLEQAVQGVRVFDQGTGVGDVNVSRQHITANLARPPVAGT
jgi:hypothetical protein